MFKFGVEEKARKMVKTELKNEEGETLWVGNKITIYNAFAGVYGREEGYVLTANIDKGYYPFPSPDELKDLQAADQIPKDLPPAKMNGMDLFGSFMLWWIMVPLILWFVVAEKVKTKIRARNPEPAKDPEPETPPAEETREAEEPSSF